ncbi:low molecular weight phosphatase family protein [Haladaptatus halobius]|uniref:arsenate-mycothiol transferase ArsC n=1 Tax=Haladaptatus halobius TaxID=2884875 RepID=UPI001D0BC907|nr:low molecular weight phosphatase family protein [Haladaptatus halobius]
MSDTPRPVSRIAFVCVQNAGRSQMATAFAERERDARDLDVEIVTGGTDPADRIHEEVVEAMAEPNFDLARRTPREVTFEELRDCGYVVTMGCSATDVCPATWSGENRDWGLDDPEGKTPEEVRKIRDEIAVRVRELFDEIEAEHRD